MISAAETLYQQFHATYLSSVSKWEKTTSAKKQEIQDARQTHKRAMNEASNNILLLEKEISGLRSIETAAQTEAEKQQNALAAVSQEVELGRRTRQELDREQAALAQNVAITLENLKMRQAGL
jgi:type II secretory pathway component PulC